MNFDEFDKMKGVHDVESIGAELGKLLLVSELSRKFNIVLGVLIQSAEDNVYTHSLLVLDKLSSFNGEPDAVLMAAIINILKALKIATLDTKNANVVFNHKSAVCAALMESGIADELSHCDNPIDDNDAMDMENFFSELFRL